MGKTCRRGGIDCVYVGAEWEGRQRNAGEATQRKEPEPNHSSRVAAREMGEEQEPVELW